MQKNLHLKAAIMPKFVSTSIFVCGLAATATADYDILGECHPRHPVGDWTYSLDAYPEGSGCTGTAARTVLVGMNTDTRYPRITPAVGGNKRACVDVDVTSESSFDVTCAEDGQSFTVTYYEDDTCTTATGNSTTTKNSLCSSADQNGASASVATTGVLAVAAAMFAKCFM